MASTPLQCAPLLVIRSLEGGSFGGTGMSTTKSNLHRTGCGCCENARRKDVVRCWGFRGAAGEPLAMFQSLSKSSLFGGSIDLPQHRCTEASPERRKVPRPLRKHAVQAIPRNVEMLEAYEIERKVRDYELDHYGVVNNAVYAQFCQQARTELLENIGFRPDGVTESGQSMAISDMTMKFVSPLRSGDRYIVSSRVAGTTAVRLIFEDHIYRLPDRQLVMTAKSTVVVLGPNGKPGRLPDEIKMKLIAGYSTNCEVKMTNGNVKANAARTDDLNGNSSSDQVSGDSTKRPLNAYPLNGYVDGNLVNGYITGNSLIDPVTGHLSSDHLHGNSTSGHVNGDSTNDPFQVN